MATIRLDGSTLSTAEISLVSRGAKVEVATDAWIKVDAARAVVERILEAEKLFTG